MLFLTKKKCSKIFKHKLLFFIILFSLYYFGAFTHIFELRYETNFIYPSNQNIVKCITALETNNSTQCDIINSHQHSFLIENKDKCEPNHVIRLVLLIKSAVHNFDKRTAIRNTWGHEDRFSDVLIKRIFIVGINQDNTVQNLIRKEHNEYKDIVQADFLDTYFNNTLKTMIGFKWAKRYCSKAQFYLFSDDDMYVSIKNVLRFIRNPTEYPQYLKNSNNSAVSNFLSKAVDYELPENVKLYAGFVYITQPHRHLCSKWYVPLHEYPYDKFPPYASAGCYIVSQQALNLMYYASYFTKHFRFDDVYLGLLAKKINIEPFHSSYFYMFKNPYNAHNYRYIISSHGYHSDELMKIWNEQKTLGNA